MIQRWQLKFKRKIRKWNDHFNLINEQLIVTVYIFKDILFILFLQDLVIAITVIYVITIWHLLLIPRFQHKSQLIVFHNLRYLTLFLYT